MLQGPPQSCSFDAMALRDGGRRIYMSCLLKASLFEEIVCTCNLDTLSGPSRHKTDLLSRVVGLSLFCKGS